VSAPASDLDLKKFTWDGDEITARMGDVSTTLSERRAAYPDDLSCEGTTMVNKNFGSVTDLLFSLYTVFALESKQTMINIDWSLAMIRFSQQFDKRLE
jgi:hypothetical protein